MELLYLYIEDFRNLKKLQLNFSPDYDIYLSDKAGDATLDVRTRDNQLRNLFGEEVINVNGIIGINGSGKSSILELICMLAKGGDFRHMNKFILLFRRGKRDRLEMKTNFENLNTKGKRISKNQIAKSFQNLSVIFFSNVIDRNEKAFSKDVIDLSKRYGFVNPRETETATHVRFLLSDYRQSAGMPLPGSILLVPKFAVITSSSKLNPLKKHLPIYHGLFNYYKKALKINQDPLLEFRWTFRFSVLNYLLEGILRKGKVDPINEYEDGDLKLLNELFDQEITNNAFKGSLVFSGKVDMLDMHKALDLLIQALLLNFHNLLDINRIQFTPLLEFDDHLSGIDQVAVFKSASGEKWFKFQLGAVEQKIFKAFARIFDFPEIVQAEWAGISSGHRAFINLFAHLHSAVRRVGQHDNVLICIDEGDLYLHPEWQREFLSKILKVVPAILKKKLQFILTTHSPFLVSDLPRENLVLLKPNSNGICEVVDSEESIKRTFGANIIDLFMGPFFLDKGTISEFSLEQIRYAITIALNKAQSSPEEVSKAKALTEIIGDEMIKAKLERMLADD